MMDNNFRQALAGAGAKQALPKRPEGWLTKAELEKLFGAPYNDKRFGRAMDRLLTDGKLLKMDAYDPEVKNHCTVYKWIGEAENDPPGTLVAGSGIQG